MKVVPWHAGTQYSKVIWIWKVVVSVHMLLHRRNFIHLEWAAEYSKVDETYGSFAFWSYCTSPIAWQHPPERVNFSESTKSIKTSLRTLPYYRWHKSRTMESWESWSETRGWLATLESDKWNKIIKFGSPLTICAKAIIWTTTALYTGPDIEYCSSPYLPDVEYINENVADTTLSQGTLQSISLTFHSVSHLQVACSNQPRQLKQNDQGTEIGYLRYDQEGTHPLALTAAKEHFKLPLHSFI